MSHFFRYLLNEYGWRGALLITSGIMLQLCVSGAIISLYCTKTKPEDRKNPRTKALQNNNNKFKNSKSLTYHNEKIEMTLYLPAKHKSMMDLKMDSSYQCLSEKRATSCDLVPGNIGSLQDVLSKRRIRADSIFGKSLSSIHELYQSAILYNEAEERQDQTELNKMLIITKEVFTDSNFIFLSLNVLLFCFGLSVVFTHIVAYSASVGRNPNEINTILSALGISNLLGRILLGVIGNSSQC